jgi:hypothetical protein
MAEVPAMVKETEQLNDELSAAEAVLRRTERSSDYRTTAAPDGRHAGRCCPLLSD